VENYHIVAGKPAHRMLGDAGLVDATLNAKRLPARVDHFGHERQAVQRAVGVQGRKDLRVRSHDNSLSGTEAGCSHLSQIIIATETWLAQFPSRCRRGRGVHESFCRLMHQPDVLLWRSRVDGLETTEGAGSMRNDRR